MQALLERQGFHFPEEIDPDMQEGILTLHSSEGSTSMKGLTENTAFPGPGSP
jgi:hypothetical protein